MLDKNADHRYLYIFVNGKESKYIALMICSKTNSERRKVRCR